MNALSGVYVLGVFKVDFFVARLSKYTQAKKWYIGSEDANI